MSNARSIDRSGLNSTCEHVQRTQASFYFARNRGSLSIGFGLVLFCLCSCVARVELTQSVDESDSVHRTEVLGEFNILPR